MRAGLYRSPRGRRAIVFPSDFSGHLKLLCKVGQLVLLGEGAKVVENVNDPVVSHMTLFPEG